MKKEAATKVIALAPVKARITTISATVENAVIENAEGLGMAVDVLSNIKDLAKKVKASEKAERDPLNAELAILTKKYKPVKTDLEKAEDSLKTKMIAYEEKVEAKRAADAEKLEARVDRGTMRVDTAMRKMDDLETVGSSVAGAKGSINFREVRTVKIVDPKAIPLKYLMNEKVLDALRAAVRTDVLNGTKVEGVEIVIEKQVASR